MSAGAPRSVLGSRLGYWLLGVALLAAVFPHQALACALLGNLLLALLYAWDARRLAGAELRVVRVAPARLRARQRAAYVLELRLVSGPALQIELEDVLPAELVVEPARHALRLALGASVSVPAQLRAASHGLLAWEAVAVRKQSALGLCARIEQLPCPQRLRVLPQLPLGRRALLALERRELGGVPQRLASLGQGQEVEALREYVATDAMRSIDWKATAKRGRPITRSYRPERSQALWIVLDASRAMTLAPPAAAAPAEAGTRFDLALAAALELADAALAAGDRVGLLVYGREPLLSVLPGRGRAHFVRLLERALSVRAQATELHVPGLIGQLSRLARKRCLLVMFTDLDNEADLHALAQHAPLLARRHLLLGVSLQANRNDAAQPELAQDGDVYRRAAALSLQAQRARLSRDLARHGMPVIETDGRGLSRAALRRYRDIKQSGRL